VLYSKVKGFRDIYNEDIGYWNRVESSLIALFKSYGFNEIRLPVLEKSSLFNRGIGSTTDIVEKEMFTFKDRDGEELSLRPEGTASLIRAYIENGLHNPPGIKKFYYIGNMFRRERPQKGRFRQFSQIGVEVLESSSPLLDADLISLLYNSAKILDILDIVQIEINSIGCPLCRDDYNTKLRAFLEDKIENLCNDCKRRLDRNPLRILDCKVDSCREILIDAPVMIDNLCSDCYDHFELVKEHLTLMSIPYKINKYMVRGLDYYIRTAFELTTTHLGAASAIGAGGRYDGLIKLLGGRENSPGIGFAIGLDRLVELLKLKNVLVDDIKTDYYLILFDRSALKTGLQVIDLLREKGFRVEYDYELSAVKSQMKKADRSGAKYTLILGDDELQAGEITIKDMLTGEQERILMSELYNKITI